MKSLANCEKEILQQFKDAVIFFDDQQMEITVRQWLELGFDPYKAIFDGLVPGMEEVGKLYEDQVYFIPEMLLCADVLYKGLGMLTKSVKDRDIPIKGKVLIGVVYGDIHDIGKNIVKMMLQISGFWVYDLGRDVPIEEFIKKYDEIQPDILCLSTMMSTTMIEMRKIIKKIKEKTPELKVLIGGAPVTERVARRWGASGYGQDAHHALKIAIDIMNQIKKETRCMA
ncbi:Methanogenic corrinoid protein MtbC1 [Desulfotomaculum arcticum]|uniref:Methanogenic corrinoid protein MtbC1 n=1 Tax=Desulfotruncus arcticus DSM 17038 TaxID=1121424 RepID=A0A1I2Q665_9FIRM|nr:cobalamin-dependent protein [Desulfotruncus arcticus]SFG23808.1 Methanogenic corrinoid protein MtbC1 [Desulfotomaculum arcticum] [Desulfotruncus arcticus DSM 17038]